MNTKLKLRCTRCGPRRTFSVRANLDKHVLTHTTGPRAVAYCFGHLMLPQRDCQTCNDRRDFCDQSFCRGHDKGSIARIAAARA